MIFLICDVYLEVTMDFKDFYSYSITWVWQKKYEDLLNSLSNAGIYEIRAF